MSEQEAVQHNADPDLAQIEQNIYESLKSVVDPEIGIDIINLGLVYKIEAQPDGHVDLEMTLTSFGCPLGPHFQKVVKDTTEDVEGVEDADVRIVFSPPWDPRTMASEDAKIMLGIY
jgi:metal-sulfur cluster biosynthetic enzyme